jgi:membrane glycosyltransferase
MGRLGLWGLRAAAVAFSLLTASGAFILFLQFGGADGIDTLDVVRALLIFISTLWLAWGAALGLIGLTTTARAPEYDRSRPITGRTIVLMPVYNEDPITTFTRLAAMDTSLKATGTPAEIHFAILSDTRKDEIAAREELLFARLVADQDGIGRYFYRRRAENTGKKAGNIEDFIARSGAAYDYAVILDADSLIEGETILEMIRRMQAEPRLGLLQTLPKIVNANSRFGRAMQFSASFFSPVFCRGLAMMQGHTGPFWGHNAIVRVKAFAEACGLPVLRGDPPFGGHVLSHDYVEAALLARAGWIVRVDDDLEGSFEEGPENIVDYAKRERRWCQGNLQHARIIGAPRLRLWSRFVFAQLIMAYIAPLFWLGFIAASVMAPAFVVPPDYFPEPNWPFPYFPPSEAWKAVGLFIGIFGLLIVPKLLVATKAAMTGRASGFGGSADVFASTVLELLFTSLAAPVLLMYATRSVWQVLSGSDGGWPSNNRGEGRLSYEECFLASWWIVAIGAGGLAITWQLSPGLFPWLLPVGLPMILAPLILRFSSMPARTSLMQVPADTDPPAILALHDRYLAAWEGRTDDNKPEDSGPELALA